MAIVLVVLAWAGPAAASSDVARPLVETAVVGGAAAPAPDGPSRTLRTRRAVVRRDVLVSDDGAPQLGVGQKIGLRLFDDASFTATITDVTEHPSSGRTWSGPLDGGDGHAVIAIDGGAVVGSVVVAGSVYRIGYAPDGTQVVEQVDVAAFPREAEPIVPDPSIAAEGVASGATADSAAQIDVMILYTAAARDDAGGTTAIRAEAALAVGAANLAYANNGLVQRLRLVFTGEIAITESSNVLGVLRNNPTVSWLRNANRADLVTLLTGAPIGICGVAYLMTVNSTGFASNGYNVVDRTCATGNLTYPHELGHNMGAHHDPYVAADNGLFSYSHGFVDLVARFRTIMAYPDQCADSGFSCPKIHYFSTPGQTVNGRVIGNASVSDNERTLSQSADTVAIFRAALVPSLTVSAGVNQASFAGGDTLVLSIGFDNPGVAEIVDVFVGVLLPDGQIASLTASGHAFGSVGNLGSLQPIATGLSLATPFSAQIPGFVSYQLSGSEPPGGLAFFVLVARAGGLTAGLASGEMLGVSVTPFSFTTAGGGGGGGGNGKPLPGS